MKRTLIIGILSVMVLVACGDAASPVSTGPGRDEIIQVFKSPN